MAENPLGRRVPENFEHVEKYPVRLARADVIAERVLPFNAAWKTFYDQGREGSCVGFAASQAMSVMNRVQYDARKLYRRAQEVDDWPETPPEEGTSVRA